MRYFYLLERYWDSGNCVKSVPIRSFSGPYSDTFTPCETKHVISMTQTWECLTINIGLIRLAKSINHLSSLIFLLELSWRSLSSHSHIMVIRQNLSLPHTNFEMIAASWLIYDRLVNKIYQVIRIMKAYYWCHQMKKSEWILPANTSTSDQRCFNVVD